MTLSLFLCMLTFILAALTLELPEPLCLGEQLAGDQCGSYSYLRLHVISEPVLLQKDIIVD